MPPPTVVDHERAFPDVPPPASGLGWSRELAWTNVSKIGKAGPSKFARGFWGESNPGDARIGADGVRANCVSCVAEGARRAVIGLFRVEIAPGDVVSGGLARGGGGREALPAAPAPGVGAVFRELSRADRPGFANGVTEHPHTMIKSA